MNRVMRKIWLFVSWVNKLSFDTKEVTLWQLNETEEFFFLKSETRHFHIGSFLCSGVFFDTWPPFPVAAIVVWCANVVAEWNWGVWGLCGPLFEEASFCLLAEWRAWHFSLEKKIKKFLSSHSFLGVKWKLMNSANFCQMLQNLLLNRFCPVKGAPG